MTPRAPLFVPANRSDRFGKAAASGADAIILDCEDAVAPSEKEAARQSLRTDFTDLPIFVRINALGTLWYQHDLDAVAALPGVGVILPKAELGDDLRHVASRTGAGPVIALIETVKGLAEARAIAATPGVTALAFGSVDFSADCGCAHTRLALLSARAELVIASRLAGLSPPIDGVTIALDDVAQAQDDARHAAEMGFGGKLCIHPRQVEPVRLGLRPSDSEIAWANNVLGVGPEATSVDGAMVDRAVQLRARSILLRSN